LIKVDLFLKKKKKKKKTSVSLILHNLTSKNDEGRKRKPFAILLKKGDNGKENNALFL
jgi:hypothetical protein